MATLPSATVRLSTSGGGVGVGSDLACILSCTSSGDTTVRQYTKVSDLVANHGAGEGIELAAHYVQLTGKPFLFRRLPTVTAGATQLDIEGVTGTSVISLTGTAVDDAHIVFRVVAGGTIGTAGITFRVSIDGENTPGPIVRLGTATSYAVPGTGITLAFAAGTLVAGDSATVYTTAPKSDAAGISAALAAVAAQSRLPRLVILCGDVSTPEEIQGVMDAINAYETTYGRHSRVICNVRDVYAPAKMQGNPSDVDFVAAADTITRNTGSWITDGFKVGMSVTIAGSASNNAYAGTVVTVTTTVLTVTNGIADEANVLGSALTITGIESASAWRTAIETIVGTSPGTLKVAHRVALRGGRCRRQSPLDGFRRRRPYAWASACRAMSHDVHVSPAKVSLGPLEGWTIHRSDGSLEDHDERIDGGLLAIRIGCATTHDVDSAPGVYEALPLTLDTDNASLSRLPVGFVADIACTVAKAETTRRLNEDVLLNSDGTIRESEAKRIESYVQSVLGSELLTERPEGQRASDVTFTMARDVDLRTPGAIVPCEVLVTPRGYLEAIATTVRVSRAGG